MALRWGIWIVPAILVALLPLFFKSGFAINALNEIGIMIIFALSYNMLLGQSGMLSFGHAVYSGMGAYLTIHALNLIGKGSFSFPVTLLPLIGGLAGMLCGVILGYVSTKRAGTTFAMISMGIGEMVAACSLMFPAFFGGEAGISGNRMLGNGWFGISYGPSIEVFYLIAAWMLLAVIAMYAITHTPLGRMMNAVRDNPERAEFVGYNPQRVRYLAMILAGFFAGIAGGLSAINYEIVTSEAVGAVRSGNVLVMAFIGGMGQFFGPIIGAVLMVFLGFTLSTITKAWLFYFGLLFLSMVLFAPGGLSGLIFIHLPALKSGQLHKLIPSYAAAFLSGLLAFSGVVGLVELTYRRLAEADHKLKLFGTVIDSDQIMPWAVSLILIGVGAGLYRNAWKNVHAAWRVVNLLTYGGK
ncbi:MAG: branched-chain amino acid ABC transporter permease [Burkholderiales bacterium]